MNHRPYTAYNNVPMVEQKAMARGYDFLPLLSAQQKYHGEIEVYRLNARCNLAVEEVAYGGRETVTEFGTIEQDPTNTERTLVRNGGLNPFDRSDSIFDTAPFGRVSHSSLRPLGVSEMIIESVGFLYPLPDDFADREITDGATVVAHELINSGNRGTKGYKMSGIPTFDAYTAMKTAYEARGLPTGVLEDRLRGHLVTNGVVLDNGVTHQELAVDGVLTPLLRSVHQTGGFTRDLGIPDELSSDHGGRIFELENHGALMWG